VGMGMEKDLACCLPTTHRCRRPALIALNAGNEDKNLSSVELK